MREVVEALLIQTGAVYVCVRCVCGVCGGVRTVSGKMCRKWCRETGANIEADASSCYCCGEYTCVPWMVGASYTPCTCRADQV